MPRALQMMTLANGGRRVPTYMHPDMFASRAVKAQDGRLMPMEDIPSQHVLAANGADLIIARDARGGSSFRRSSVVPRLPWRVAVDLVGKSARAALFRSRRKVAPSPSGRQPAFPMLLAGVAGAIYPCHVPAAEMRRRPIGTGPYKFQEFKPNEFIKVARNPDYWKPGLPYLDGIEYLIIRENKRFIANAGDSDQKVLTTQ